MSTPFRVNETTWEFWAAESKREPGTYEDFGHYKYTKAFGHENPVRVTVTETEDGPYWGWLEAGEDVPRMIYRREPLFRVCFPYGVEAEEKAGHGRLIRCDVRDAWENV